MSVCQKVLGLQKSKEHLELRALAHGYLHLSSGRIDHLEVNPNYAHIQSLMKPLMKQGTNHVYLLLEQVMEHANIVTSTCDCAAGYIKCTCDVFAHCCISVDLSLSLSFSLSLSLCLSFLPLFCLSIYIHLSIYDVHCI